MGDLVTKPIGAEAGLKLSLEGGQLKIEVGYDGKGLDGGVFMALDSEYFMRKLAEVIPGEIDNAIIEVMIAALKAQQ